MKLIPDHCLYRSWPWWLSGGLIMVQFLPDLWLAEWLIFSIVLTTLYFTTSKGHAFIIALLLVALGGTWGSVWGGLNLERGLPTELIKQDVVVLGVIQDLPQQRHHALRFRFKIESLSFNNQDYAFKGPVLLNWYDKPYPDLRVGDRWQLTIRLKPAHGSLNPGGFNYEKWLFSQGIRATGYVRESEKAHLLEPSGRLYAIDQFRTQVKHFIDAHNLNMGGILRALSVGERSGITKQQWRVFRDTGTAHLIAISGLHIGLVAGLAYFLARFLWRHSLLVTTQFPAQHIAKMAALLAAGLYAALAGFALPTLRAFSMLLAYFVLQGLRRSPSTLFTLGFVLAVVLILDPLAPLQASLWLSFGAVAAIAYVMTSQSQVEDLASLDKPGLFKTIGKRLAQWTQIQWAVFVALMPLLLLFFGQFSLVSFFANALAIPLIGTLLVPLILLAIFCFSLGWASIASSLFTFANALLGFIWPLLERLSTWPYSVWLAAPPVWAVVLAILSAIILLAPNMGRYRVLGVFGFIPLLLPRSTLIEQEAFEMHVLDVGQGLAVLVQTAGHALIYDAGIKYDSGFDAGSTMVLPFLQQKGINKIDTIVASHQNIDHYGGFDAILEAHPKAVCYSSAAFYADSAPCNNGVSWSWEGVSFNFLHPPADNQKSDNNGSCVLKVSSPYGSALLTGDIERRVELDLVASSKNNLRADILLAPHHGSRSSSSSAFIKQVDPKLAVVSAGYLNHFNHPHEQISQRYLNNDVALLNTATSGAVQIRFNASGIQATPWRSSQNFYWLAKFDEAQVFSFTPNERE